VPGSSISSSDALQLTPSRARAAIALEAAATAARPRGAWTFVARASLLLVIAALPVAFSMWIDPARLVAPRSAEREIARVLAAGGNVTDVANYDDRAIERYLAPLRPERAEVLVLGSSRMQPMPASAFDGKRFVNGAMQAGVLDDVFGVYGLYDVAGRRPNRVVLGVDPWTESWEGAAAWGALADERAMVMRRVGIPVSPARERLALVTRKARTLATPEYFRLALHSYRRYGSHGIPWRVTDHAQNTEKTRLPDGTVVWTDVSIEQAAAAARAYAAEGIAHDERFRDLAHRAAGRESALERFVRYLSGEGVGVTVVLVPLAPEAYDAAVRMPGRTVAEVERELRTVAARAGAQVVGSYDPRVVGVTTRDFFDESHLRPDALARLLAGRR
jgi:hypothetical protein